MSSSFQIKSLAFAICFLCNITAYSQQGLNVAGNTATINGVTFEYSIGEMTLVSTERHANLIVTQGLLQPVPKTGTAAPGNNETAPTLAGEAVKVYPNPTLDLLHVESFEQEAATISTILYDASGKQVLSKELQQKKGINKFSFDLRNYAAGSYYLMIRKPGPQGVMENYSYKIQKTN